MDGMAITADDIRLERTCYACPEQYDAYDPDGRQVGYLRLRHGRFTVDMPDAGGTEVYNAAPIGDGIFAEDERDRYLGVARQKIADHLNAARGAELPASVWQGEFSLFGVTIHCHVLDDGTRIVEAADMAALLEAIEDGAPAREIDADALAAFARWQKGLTDA